jgi:hypothetical protein
LDSFAALGSLDSPGIDFGLGYGRSRLGIANGYFSNLHQPNGWFAIGILAICTEPVICTENGVVLYRFALNTAIFCCNIEQSLKTGICMQLLYYSSFWPATKSNILRIPQKCADEHIQMA